MLRPPGSFATYHRDVPDKKRDREAGGIVVSWHILNSIVSQTPIERWGAVDTQRWDSYERFGLKLTKSWSWYPLGSRHLTSTRGVPAKKGDSVANSKSSSLKYFTFSSTTVGIMSYLCPCNEEECLVSFDLRPRLGKKPPRFMLIITAL